MCVVFLLVAGCLFFFASLQKDFRGKLTLTLTTIARNPIAKSKQWIIGTSFLRVDRSDGSGLFRSGWIPVRYVGGAPNGNDLVVP